MTAAERARLGTTSKMLTDHIASLRGDIKALIKQNEDLVTENLALTTANDILLESEKQCRFRIIDLIGDLSAKNIEIRRLENEILRLKMIIDEKA